MNIVRQTGASIGTAVLSVILASEIASRLGPILGAVHSRSGSSGLATLQHLPPRAHAAIAAPLADAFASTFVWAVVLVVAALVPALAMALMGRRTRAAGPTRRADGLLVLE
jgi:hypothetical protein